MFSDTSADLLFDGKMQGHIWLQRTLEFGDEISVSRTLGGGSTSGLVSTITDNSLNSEGPGAWGWETRSR